ncbi:MAG: 2-phosphosulfolactate phosphatase [Chloroflexi bacterium]|nr:2-phosphosulfolactate phosphatase [Chloroflexota bacterium]
MQIDVALLPALLKAPERTVCVVVDSLRATSAIATLFARGIEEIAVTASVEEGLALKASRMPDRLLCGESGGLPPEGFDHGNSPSEFASLDLRGRRAIIATSNGTRALVAASESPAVFAGSLLNATAVVNAAASEAAARALDVTFVCAGTEMARAFSLEDTAVCGALVEILVRDHPGPIKDLKLTDGAMAAYRVWRSYSSPRLVMGEAVHGRLLAKLGLAADLDFCSQIDLYSVAPRLTRHADGGLSLTLPSQLPPP